MNPQQLMNARSIRQLDGIDLDGIDLSESVRLLDCADAVLDAAGEQVNIDSAVFSATTPEDAIKAIDAAADIELRRPYRQEHAGRLAGLYTRNAMAAVHAQKEAIADALATRANELVDPLLEACRQLPTATHMLEARRIGSAGILVQKAFAEAKELAEQIEPYDRLRTWLHDTAGVVAGHGPAGVAARYCRAVTPEADANQIAAAIGETSPLRPWHPLLSTPGVERIGFTTIAEAAETIARLQAAAAPKKVPGFERTGLEHRHGGRGLMAWEGSRGDGKTWQPPGWQRLRALVLERDGYRCVQCGSTVALEVDHITPVYRGGGHDLANLQTLCRRCHATKSGREGQAARPTARREPEKHPGLRW